MKFEAIRERIDRVTKCLTLMMSTEIQQWLTGVRQGLCSINMEMDDWQSIWPFDFEGEHRAGTLPNDAAMKANRFWWKKQNKSLGKDCQKTPDCWLPRAHQDDCQSITE